LVPALKNLINKISSSKGLQVQFLTHELNSRLDEQTEISIYRIILELINNIVKHANATKATVQLIKYPDYINITIEDNGKGFDVSKINDEKTGIGLGNVAARVNYLKGKIEIDTRPGKGTTIVIDIPLKYQIIGSP
jgi:signal transduction histidine kinase